MARCSICYTAIRPDEPETTCPECSHSYHRSCWDEIGGCGTYGCSHAAKAEKPPPPTVVGTGWGDTKECPSCRRSIPSSLLLCGCGARFPWADPMTAAEYLAWLSREQALKSARSTLVVLFILTLLGLPAPLTGAIAGVYAYVKRDDLAGANGTYLAMGYGSAGLAAVYVAIIAALSLAR